MTTTITATELARSLSDILNRVRYRNERFIIQRNGEIVATISPPESVEPVEGVMLHEALRKLGDLKMPGDGFADDLEEIQKNQPLAEFPDWPS